MLKNPINKNDLCKKSMFYFLAWMIPGVIFLLSMAIIKAAPFGDNTILLSDSVGQYIDFIGYFKTILTGENNLLYTFSKNLGGDMISLSSYYLLSPFNVLFLFSSISNLPLMYTLVVVLKVSACGGVFYWAASKRNAPSWSLLVFSTAYALMAYNVMYEWNIMWLDGVIILPLMGLGVERIWNNKSSVLYIVSLGYALLTNFYIGYMLCIASVLFCFVRFVLYDGKLKEKCKILVVYIFASVIGGLSTAFVWIPSFLSLRNGRAQFSSDIFSFDLNFTPLEFCTKLVSGSGGDQQLLDGLPNVFCGTIILFLTLAFFVSKKIPLKIRLSTLVVILVLTGSFFFFFPDVVWHGFSPNNSFNYRYSFVFSYVIIKIAEYAYFKRVCDSLRVKIYAALPLIAMYVLLLCSKYDYLQPMGIYVAIMVLIVLMIFVGKHNKKRIISGLVCAVVVAEIGLNCYMLLDGIVGKTRTLKFSDWTNQTTTTAQAVEKVKNKDDGFYRMEKTYSKTHNDAMLYAYNGLSHFSSTELAFVPDFMEKMGFPRYKQIWAYYDVGSTVATESFLGVKYVLSKTDLPAKKGYKLVDKVDDIGIYENPYALPLAMYSNQSISGVSMDNSNYFELQNQIWSSISGAKTDIMLPVATYETSLSNLNKSVDTLGNNVYKKIDSEKESFVRYEITVAEEMPLYFYFSAPDYQRAKVRVNGADMGAYFNLYHWGMECIGTYQPGDKVTIDLVLTSNVLTVTKEMFSYENLEALQKSYESVQESSVSLNRDSSSKLEGQITVNQNGYLLLSIPYDESWKVQIDGETVETVNVLDTFIAVEVGEGTHKFNLKFVPKGLYIGCALSFVAVSLGIFVAVWHRKQKFNRI